MHIIQWVFFQTHNTYNIMYTKRDVRFLKSQKLFYNIRNTTRIICSRYIHSMVFDDIILILRGAVFNIFASFSNVIYIYTSYKCNT